MLVSFIVGVCSDSLISFLLKGFCSAFLTCTFAPSLSGDKLAFMFSFLFPSLSSSPLHLLFTKSRSHIPDPQFIQKPPSHNVGAAEVIR